MVIMGLFQINYTNYTAQSTNSANTTNNQYSITRAKADGFFLNSNNLTSARVVFPY
jgi:hypothetical protein